MNPRAERSIRWFIGLSLLGGGLVLLAGAAQFGTLSGASPWVIPIAGLVAVVLAVITAILERGAWSPVLPATGWIVSVLLGILWARLDPVNGHAFLSGYAAVVAFATGIGIFRRQLWAWPVGLASVAGFGPIVLVLAPLPEGAVAAGFVLFAADVLALLAIQRSYFGPR
jgi:hypothetical protein